MLVIMKIKQFLRNFPMLVYLKRKVWNSWLNTPPLPIFTDKDYFRKSFSTSPNNKSLDFEKGLVIGSFRGTSYLLSIHPQNLIESHVFLNQIWEPRIAELVSSYLNESNVAVIDVGANIGATSIPLAKHFPDTSFFLFEPHPAVFEQLRNNLSFNKLSNISAQNIAITDQSTPYLPFYAQKNANNFGLSSFSLNQDIQDYDLIQVKCGALDNLLDIETPLRILKIDTQGHELGVLKSAKRLIEKHRPIIFFEFESEYFNSEEIEDNTKGEILSFFKRLHYELYMVGSECNFMPNVTLKDYYHGDIIAVPLATDV